MVSPLTILTLSDLTTSSGPVILKIKTADDSMGISLLELLSALEIIRHSPAISLVGLTSDSPDSYDFTQAVFQAKYYFPEILAPMS